MYEGIDKQLIPLIKNFIEKVRLEHLPQLANIIPADAVLRILEQEAVVIYFPEGLNSADSEEKPKNNGFLFDAIDFAGEKKHFVYINSAQTIDKQIFTAAHELGHLWQLNVYISERAPDIKYNEEDLMSRFAAEFLMPEKEFIDYASEFGSDYLKDGKISLFSMLCIISKLMNIFLCPYKAVVRRLYELDFISHKAIDFLIPTKQEDKLVLMDKIKEINIEFGYERLNNPDGKKWMSGLADMLDLAEKEGCVSKAKIAYLRRTFSLPENLQNKRFSASIPLGEKGDK